MYKRLLFTLCLFSLLNYSFAQEGNGCINAIEIPDPAQGPSTYSGYNGFLEDVNICFRTLHPFWYKFTAGSDGGVIIDTLGSDYDTILQAFSGSCDELTCIVSNDDTYDLLSSIGFTVNSGETYYVIVGGFDIYQGNFKLNIEYFPDVDYNECSNALDFDLPLDTSVSFTSVNFGGTEFSNCTYTQVGPLFYSFTAPADGVALFNTLGSLYSVDISSFSGDCDSIECIDYQNSQVEFEIFENQKYYIVLGFNIYNFQRGFITMNGFYFDYPQNIDCSNSISILEPSLSENTITGVNYGLNTSFNSLCEEKTYYNSLWYSFNATQNGFVYVDITSTILPYFNVYEGECGSLSCLDFTSFSHDISLGFNVTSGNTYFLLFGFLFDGEYYGSLEFTYKFNTETNIDCNSAYNLQQPSNTPITIEGNSIQGTSFSSECDVFNNPITSWYTFTSLNTGYISISFSSYSISFNVYSGECNSLQCFSGDMFVGFNLYQFEVIAGETYFLVLGFGSNAGPFEMTYQYFELSPNIECMNALEIVDPVIMDGFYSSNNIGSDISFSDCDGSVLDTAIYFKFLSTQAGVVTIDAYYGSYIYPTVSIFSGTCDDIICVDYQLYDISIVTFDTIPGTTYYIVVGGYLGEAGYINMYASGLTDGSGVICTYPIIFDVVGSGTIFGDNFNSIISYRSCSNIAYPIWYKFTATSSMAVEINTFGTFAASGYAANMGLFLGNCDDLDCLVGVQYSIPSDDSQLKFVAIEGNEYILNVGNRYNFHDFQINYISEEIINATVCNYANIINQVPTGSYSGVTSLFGFYDYSCSQSQENAVWYTFTGSSYSTVTVSSLTDVKLMSGDCNSLECIDFFTETYSFNANLGETYFIVLSTNLGEYEFDIEFEFYSGEIVCSDAIEIDILSNTTVAGNNIGSNFTWVSCNNIQETPIWYKFISPSDGEVAIDTIGSSIDTTLSISSGNCEDLYCISFNNNTNSTDSFVTITVNRGESYYVIVNGNNAEEGEYQLNFTFEESLYGICEDAYSLQLSDGLISINGNNINNIITHFGCTGVQLKSVWYSLTSLTHGFVTINTQGSSIQTTLYGLYSLNGSCDELECIEYNDNTSPSISFEVAEGITYYIVIGGKNSIGGDYILNIDFNEVECTPDCFDKECGSDGCGGYCGFCNNPETCDDEYQVCTFYSNEICQNSIEFIPSDSTITFSGNTQYSNIPDESCSFIIPNPMWYSFTVPISGIISIDLSLSEIDASFSLASGDCNFRVCIEETNTPVVAKSIMGIGKNFKVERGNTYFIIVGGNYGEDGNYFLRVNFDPDVPPSFTSTSSPVVSTSTNVTPTSSVSVSPSTSRVVVTPSLSTTASNTQTLSLSLSNSVETNSDSIFFEDYTFSYSTYDYSSNDDDDIVVTVPNSSFTFSLSTLVSSFEDRLSSSNSAINSLSIILFTTLILLSI